MGGKSRKSKEDSTFSIRAYNSTFFNYLFFGILCFSWRIDRAKRNELVSFQIRNWDFCCRRIVVAISCHVTRLPHDGPIQLLHAETLFNFTERKYGFANVLQNTLILALTMIIAILAITFRFSDTWLLIIFVLLKIGFDLFSHQFLMKRIQNDK